MELCKDEGQMAELKAKVECEGPIDNIYKFDGRLTVVDEGDNEKKISLSYENFVLRGSSLR